MSVNADERAIALTFDDGPNPPYTEQILELLAQYDAKATFFVVGQNVKEHPDIVRETFLNGNEVGNHSWDHSRLILRSPSFVTEQIESTDKAIRSTGYQGNIYFRAPYGHKLFVLPYILWKMNRQHILWSIELGDWNSPPPEEMLRTLDENLTNGSIILLHDGDDGDGDRERENTVKLVELILEKYTAEEYRFVTISELLSYREGNSVSP